MKKILLNAAVAVFLLFSVSCNDSDVGIFYGLSVEEKVKDYSMPNSVTSDTMIKTGGYLYVAAGTIFKKQAEGRELDWNRVPNPQGCHYTTEMALHSDGTIFIVSYDKDNVETLLFQGDGSGTWTPVPTPVDRKICKLSIADDIIYLSDKSGNFYYSTDKGATFNQDTSLPKLYVTSTGVFDIVSDGTTRYLNAQYKIYKGQYNSWTDFTPRKGSGELKDEEEIFGRVYYDTVDDRLYAGDSEGYVYAVDTPASAASTAWIQSDDNTPSGIGLQGMALLNVPTSASTTHKMLVIGSGITGCKGYYEVHNPRTDKDSHLDPDRPRRSVEVLSDYYEYLSFDISTAPVNNFFVDMYPDGVTFDLYAMTYGFGVWKNTANSSYKRIWNRE